MPKTLPSIYHDWKQLSPFEYPNLLQSVKALPALPGSLLGWHHHLIHWGSRASDRAGVPRVSIAVEFISDAVSPLESELPLIPPGSIPDFPLRLNLIGKALLEYQRFEPSVARLEPLAIALRNIGEAAAPMPPLNEGL